MNAPISGSAYGTAMDRSIGRTAALRLTVIRTFANARIAMTCRGDRCSWVTIAGAGCAQVLLGRVVEPRGMSVGAATWWMVVLVSWGRRLSRSTAACAIW